MLVSVWTLKRPCGERSNIHSDFPPRCNSSNLPPSWWAFMASAGGGGFLGILAKACSLSFSTYASQVLWFFPILCPFVPCLVQLEVSDFMFNRKDNPSQKKLTIWMFYFLAVTAVLFLKTSSGLTFLLLLAGNLHTKVILRHSAQTFWRLRQSHDSGDGNRLIFELTNGFWIQGDDGFEWFWFVHE